MSKNAVTDMTLSSKAHLLKHVSEFGIKLREALSFTYYTTICCEFEFISNYFVTIKF
jgi:hypothetical protein